VHVRIDHAGHEELAGGVDHLPALGRRERVADGGDLLAFDQHVGDGGRCAAAIEDAGAADQRSRCLVGHRVESTGAGTIAGVAG
jgi:hypothetical protein